jgi:hypothetical protein
MALPDPDVERLKLAKAGREWFAQYLLAGLLLGPAATAAEHRLPAGRSRPQAAAPARPVSITASALASANANSSNIVPRSPERERTSLLGKERGKASNVIAGDRKLVGLCQVGG